MMKLIRLSLLLVAGIFGFAGLYGSSPSPDLFCPPEDEAACDGLGRPGGDGDPGPVIPAPVVSINDRGIGLAAYAENGDVVVRRFSGASGFSAPETVASGVEEDLDAVAAGSQVRVAWRGDGGRVSVLSGDAQSRAWDTQIDVAAIDADDPAFASGQHSSISRGLVAWRIAGSGSSGLPVAEGYGSLSLLAPHTLLTRYALGEDVSPTGLFGLRTAAAGDFSVAVWTATQRSDSLFAHVYVALARGGQWSEARRLARQSGGTAPAVDMDEAGNAIVVWQQDRDLFFDRYSAVFDSWSGPMALRSEVGLLRDLQIDVAANGRAIAAWTLANGGGVWSAAGDVSTGIWTDIQRLDLDGPTALNGRDPRVAIDRFGRALVVWRNDDRAWANEHNAGSWTPPEPLGPTQSTVDLDVNDEGLGVAVWWNGGLQNRSWNPRDPLQTYFTFGPDPGVVGLGMLFDAQASHGPFPIASYEWDWENDGTFDTNAGPVLTHAFATPGTFTTRLRVTDSAGQSATTTRTVSVVAAGEVSSQVIVSYAGPGDGSLEIQSTQPGFVPVRCSTTTPPGQPINTGTCSATVPAGYDTTIVAEYDPVRSIFSGWPEGLQQCRSVVTSTAPGNTRAECRFAANSQDRTFEVAFQIAPPVTDILRIELGPFSIGGGVLFGRPGPVSCTVENQLIRSSTGGNCSYSIARGETITVVAVPSNGSVFLGWQGCDSTPTPNDCQVTMNGLRTITARFSGG
jgi:PKD repeat protein